ncbi:MAG: hypothetical protein U1E05_26010 [Patescibacteria group bacterium]|nr:hypothetical protein [Patescibacteria group bacterium]
MPAKCELPGFNFQYPDNWSIENDDCGTARNSVTVSSPNGSFWSVARYPRSTAPETLILAAVDAMRQVYDSLEAHETRQTIAGHDLAGYDLYFYCLDMTNTAQVLAVSINESTYLVFHQAEDREHEQVGAVFLAISTSLLSGLRDLRCDLNW